MSEQILRDYFDGQANGNVLKLDVEGSRIKTGFDTSTTYIKPMETNEEYELQPTHLVKLCDDVISGNLSAENLNMIAFALMGSDFFTWDESTPTGQQLDTVIFERDNTEICYSINLENLQLWKEYLNTGKHRLKK